MTSRRTSIGGQFAPRLIEMLRSPAYRALSLSARRILDRIEIELADHGGTDNGKLPVTFDDFEQYGIHRHSIGPAIREVVVLGFVEITELGRAGNAEWRKPSLFRLTYRNTKYAPTNEWQKITEEQAELIARIARIAPHRPAAKPVSGKNKIPVAENAKSQCGNRTENTQIHSVESTTTGHSAESTTTLDISGQVGQEAKPEPVIARETKPMPVARCHATGRRDRYRVRLQGADESAAKVWPAAAYRR
jgi:hypothetical protein